MHKNFWSENQMGRKPFWGPRPRWKDIKMDFNGTRNGSVDQIYLTSDRCQ